MRIRTREKIRPISVERGDTIELRYEEKIEGVVVFQETALKEEIGRLMTLNEAVIFDVEDGDFEGAQDGIGGAFLSCKEKE